MGREYKGVVDTLSAAGIIEVNGRYSTGRDGRKSFPMSYRLAKAHRHGKSRLHTIGSAWAIDRAKTTYEIDPENLRPGGLHYRSLFDRFRIDSESASRDPRLSGHWHQWTIARFANGFEFARRCQYGRYHGLMAQMPRDGRRYITTTDNETLVLVDVSACQPVLLGYEAAMSRLVGGHDQQLHRPSQSVVTTNELSYDARFWLPEADADVQHWISLAESGDLYHFLRERVRELKTATFGIHRGDGRSRTIDLHGSTAGGFKKAVLVLLFQRVQTMRTNSIFSCIAECFPAIATFLIEVKAGGHQELARKLQRRESSLMIDRLGAALQRRFPDEPVQPIHDALLVRREFAGEAEALIKAQFASIGLRPRVKHEML
jgi:hypothetical protein